MATSESENNVRILVVAEDSLARAGLASIVAELPGCSVAGRTTGNERLTEEIEVYRPDLVIWDLGLNPAQSVDNLESARRAGIPIIVLAPDQHSAEIASARGVAGILSRSIQGRTLRATISGVMEGLTVIDQQLAGGLLSGRAVLPEQPGEPLTPRELEVLQLLASGMPNKAIASQIGVSEHTVKFHVNSILAKLGAQSRTEAVIRGMRMGLVKL